MIKKYFVFQLLINFYLHFLLQANDHQLLPSPKSERPEYDEDYVPPPRLLNEIRLYLPYNGWIEIGFTPDSDGYGNAEITLSIVISYQDGWLSLNERQLTIFFIALREVGKYNDLPGRRYLDGLEKRNERFHIRKIQNYFNIVFVDGEGDVTTIQKFKEYDVIPMLNMEIIIAERIEAMKLQQSNVIEIIESTAINCIDDSSKILKLAESCFCHNVIVQLAVNHFYFFDNFITEKNEIE